ncbi:MAG: hypothetical protein J0H69_19155 [Burkholderiales bacterium]|nr:hypothetical protein [Burkholderiales bacterium]
MDDSKSEAEQLVCADSPSDVAAMDLSLVLSHYRQCASISGEANPPKLAMNQKATVVRMMQTIVASDDLDAMQLGFVQALFAAMLSVETRCKGRRRADQMLGVTGLKGRSINEKKEALVDQIATHIVEGQAMIGANPNEIALQLANEEIRRRGWTPELKGGRRSSLSRALRKSATQRKPG